MKRTLEQAFDSLRAQIISWSEGRARADLRVFVYPPEWEALVLQKMPEFAETCREEGHPIQIEDVGSGFLRALQTRPGFVERLEKVGRPELLHDLGHVAAVYLKGALQAPLGKEEICRILVNTGSLATFVSYSAIANELAGNGADTGIPATVIAFPGEGDDRSLNMLGLRVDTNYRVPRV